MRGFLSDLTPEKNSDVFEASCGPLLGNIYRHNDKIVDGFLGIPFADPPARFERAVAAKVWKNPRDCTHYGSGCPQAGPFENMKEQMGLQFDEHNCLKLNVFAPRWKKPNEFPNGYPVMVNIFGGGFEMGTSAAYDAYSISGTLPLKDIVVVTINYRVGVFGFLTIGDTCPGNLALWDQTLALEWEFAIANGYTSATKSLLEWYKEQPVDVLTTIGSFNFSISGFMACSPNLDGVFFEKPIEELRKEAPKKSFMVGGTEYEGLIMAVPDPVYSRIGDKIDVSAKKLFGSDVVEDSEKVICELRRRYMSGVDETDEKAVRKRFIEFLGDVVFNCGIVKTAKSCSETENTVYLYSFDYCNPDGYGQLGNLLDFKASNHGNDFRYVMGDGGFERFHPSEEERNVMEFMAILYSNFAKTGNPNSEELEGNWEPFCKEHPGRYFKIDFPRSEMKENYQNGRLEMLEDIEHYH